jgi:hypothetical protein
MYEVIQLNVNFPVFRAVKIIPHVTHTQVLANHTTNVPVFGVRDQAEEVEYLEQLLEIRG